MKSLIRITVFLALTAMAACSSDKDCQVDNYEGFDRFGVARWDNQDDFTVRRYYTLVDTFVVKQPDVSVVIKVSGDVETDVDWSIDGTWYEARNVDESSNSAEGLIIRTYYPLVDSSFDYTDGMKITAVVTVGVNMVTREERIREQKFESDIFGVDFGMDSLSVKDALESIHGISRFGMRSETIGVDPLAPHFMHLPNGQTLFIFDQENHLLTEVAEFPGTIRQLPEDGSDPGEDFVVDSTFTSLCAMLGFEGDIVVSEDGVLIDMDHYRWEREGIVYRIHSRDDVFPVEPGEEDEPGTRSEDEETVYQPNSIGISYSKAPVNDLTDRRRLD